MEWLMSLSLLWEVKTPLQAAKKLYRYACRQRQSGVLDTIPPGFKPGSEIANLSVLGYDLPKVFEGRGSLEAASMGVEYYRKKWLCGAI